MEIKQALTTYLSGVSAVTSLLGSGTACQVWPVGVQDEPPGPYVELTCSTDPEYHCQGQAPTIESGSFTFACYAVDTVTVDAIAEAIRGALNNYTGVMGGAGGVTIQGVHDEGGSESYEPQTYRYSREVKLKIFYGI